MEQIFAPNYDIGYDKALTKNLLINYIIHLDVTKSREVLSTLSIDELELLKERLLNTMYETT